MKEKKTLFSFAIARGSKKFLATAALTLLASINAAFAQGAVGVTENQTESDGQVNGIDEIVGIDPSDDICTTKGLNETDNNKTFCFYNVGAKKFLSVGGYWGTHASLNVSPHALFFKKSTTSGAYYLENKLSGSGTGTYVGVQGGIYMDRGATNIRFEKSTNYTDKNKTYIIKVNNTGYLTAYPDNENMYCNYEANQYNTTDSKYKNQEWKIISKAEYYQLFNASPANMKAVVDATFLLKAPDFRVNNTEAAEWKIGRQANNADFKNKLRFGDETMYKDYTNVSTTTWTTGYNGNHQNSYGKYFYCYTRGQRNFYVYQDIKVHKAGWYLLRCNGFSTSNSMENIKANGKPLAYLFSVVIGTDGKPITSTSTASTLNVISQTEADELAKQSAGAGIGVAFFEGKYENQVHMCIDKTPDGKEISNDNPVTLRLGFYVDPTQNGASEAADNEITAVDNFKLLYAGPRRNPELVLDEESTDLRYLSEANDIYKNSVLHLNRKLNDNMWNSLILPVDLTFGQMKRTFGDAVKVAKLNSLTNSTIQFVTVEPKQDDEVMVEAFVPYIIYPPVVNTISPSYTVEKFYTSEGEDNSEWLGTNYEKSTDDNNRLTKTIPANHYDIVMVSFDRDKLKEYVDTKTWISNTIVEGEDAQRKLTCKGTMAKTYDDNGIISGRDDLNGHFFMYKGKLIQVPEGNNEKDERYSYGLKAFRCWFELNDKNESGNNGKMSLLIDGIEDSATSISDIHTDTNRSQYKRGIEGVFNMNGQIVRKGLSTDGLPKGMYIVNGKKVIIG